MLSPAAVVMLAAVGRMSVDALWVRSSAPANVTMHSRFARTRRTAEIALTGRGVPEVEEPLLDDLDVGELEGAGLDAYRRFTEEHGGHVAYPGGETRHEAALRYAEAFRLIAARREERILVVTHELAVRFAVNALADASGLDEPRLAIPNATPFLFTSERLAEAAGRIDDLARG